jgi:hypothetical protein
VEARDATHAAPSGAAVDRPARVICVLGMHRSGTSCLAGSLEQQGLFLGETNTRGPFNLRGNRENFDMMGLQGRILQESGGQWDDPPEAVVWKPEHVETARRMLAQHAGEPAWGFKDPRTLFTIDGWRQLVPDLELVGIFRHPMSVAHSLAHRNKFPVEKSLGVWKAYNQRLLGLHREDAFPLVSFDDDAPVLEEKLQRVGELLGLEPRAAGEPFFTDDLRTSPAEGDPLPEPVAGLYAELQSLAL